MYGFKTIAKKVADAVLAARPEAEAGPAAMVRTTATVRTRTTATVFFVWTIIIAVSMSLLRPISRYILTVRICPWRYTRVYAWRSVLWFRHGSVYMTIEASTILRPTPLAPAVTSI
jgi:hypothetical protein